MKKLHTFLFLMLFSTSMFSQAETPYSSVTAKRLKVINKTQCPQYFVVLGYDTCKCNDSDAYQSDLISIAPNTQTYYDYHNLGGTFPIGNNEKGIVLTRIVSHPKEKPCFSGGTIGQPCSSEPSKIKYVANDANCKPCPSENIYTIAEWIPAQTCEDDAILLFTNP